MNISERIRVLRKRKGLTQEQLGDLLGVSYMTVRRWETGKTSPKSEEIKKMAELLNTSVDYLIGLTDSETPEQPLKQLLESLSSLPINDEDIKEKVKNKNPLFSTQREYDLKKPFELGVGYWGSVVDNAQHVANIGSEQEKNIALMMLRMAEEAITGAEKTPTPATIEAHNGENSSYSVNVMNNGTMRGGG